MGLFGFGKKKQDSGKEQAMVDQKPTQTTTLTKDPVCGMDVDPKSAAAKSEYQGQTYYFCAPGCKREFDKDPAKYTSGQKAGSHSHGHGCC